MSDMNNKDQKTKEKDFNKMLNEKKDMPKVIKLENDMKEKWKGETMVIVPPLDYDKYMKKVPYGKVITTKDLREKIACDYKTDICCPLTAGIFVNIAAWASSQRESDITPYWRTLKSDGELNDKYPGGIENQKKHLEEEGHKVFEKGRKNIKYYVLDYEKMSYKL